MVQALLEGRKTQTRRLIKPQPAPKMTEGFCGLDGIFRFSKPTALHPVSHSDDDRKCPLGKPGDLLWVREAWSQWETDNGFKIPCQYRFKTDRDITPDVKWRPSIHMPKSAARIWLQVEEVRVERLQDISQNDAMNEGVESWNEDYRTEPGSLLADWKNYQWKDDPKCVSYDFPSYANPVLSFASLWQSIYGVESWEANPWLWVLKFKVLSTTGRPAIAEQEAAAS